MKFSIVTASYRQPGWLRRCARSIADQLGDGSGNAHGRLEIEHLIQDAGTGPELERWVHEHTSARLVVEPDTGIYDALNRGFARATGDIFAFLNCDEQYLPGALHRVAAAFRDHPKADLVVGDSLIINPEGRLLSFRRSTPLRPAMILTDHLYDFTCALFFRRSLWERTGPFRTDFQAAGDAEWVARALRSGAHPVYLREYLAAFAITGENLSLKSEALAETRKLRAATPPWARLARPLLRGARHLEKLLAGGYRSGPIAYDLFAADDDEKRSRFVCEQPGYRHPWA